MRTNRALGKCAAALLASAMLLASAACGVGGGHAGEASQSKPAAKTGAISVVASVGQWGSLASQIGGKGVKVTSILTSTGVDAHDFEPKTSDLTTLGKAEIVVANGVDYDSWATKSLSSDTTVVSAGQTVGATTGDNPHLWFSKDARLDMAKELTAAFSKARPAKKAYFKKRLQQWQRQEKRLDASMQKFASGHGKATYAATESVAYYLMSDLGAKDVTPQSYLQAVMNGGEVAPADLQEFQRLLEAKKAGVLVNNPQESSEMTNMITGTANKAEIPVVDVTEQMPGEYESLTDWIGALVDSITTAIDPEYGCVADDGEADDADSGDSKDSSQDAQSDESGQSGKSDADASGDAKGLKDSDTSSDASSKQKKCASTDGDAAASDDAKSKSGD